MLETPRHHLDLAAGINRAHIKAELAKANTFNAKAAVIVTQIVGSMWCAYCFCLLALCSLPAVLSGFAVFHGTFPKWMVSASVIALVAWVAQTFLQLVLLSVILVGQGVQGAASDARAEKTLSDTEKLIDLLDIHTEGGIAELAALILEATAAKPAPKPRAPRATVAKKETK